MPQLPSTVELARRRDSKAIATIVNAKTTPLKTTAKISLNDDLIQVLLESEYEPDRAKVFPVVRDLLVKLKINGIDRVRVYGRRRGNDMPSWSSEFEIVEAPAPAPTPVKLASFQLTDALPKTAAQERIAKSKAIEYGIGGAIGGVILSSPMVWAAFQMPGDLMWGYVIGIGGVIAICYVSGYGQGASIFTVSCPSCSHGFDLSGYGGDCPACRSKLFIDDRGDCQKVRLGQ